MTITLEELGTILKTYQDTSCYKSTATEINLPVCVNSRRGKCECNAEIRNIQNRFGSLEIKVCFYFPWHSEIFIFGGLENWTLEQTIEDFNYFLENGKMKQWG